MNLRLFADFPNENAKESKSADENAILLRGTLHRRSDSAGKLKRLKAQLGYLRGRTESFIALPTRNLSVVFAGI
jgi:hypothetical protein